MKANSLRKKLNQVSGVLATAAVFAAFTGALETFLAAPATVANAQSQNMMGRWAPDERWTKWQEDVDRGLNAYKRKDYTLASQIYLKAIEKAKTFGDNPSKVVEVLAKLIVAMIDQGEAQRAEPYYKDALSISMSLNKKNALDEVGAICMEDLANTYDECSDIVKKGIPDTSKGRARVKFFLNHAIDIRANVFTQNHPKLILTRSQLANVCITEHDWNGARVQLEKIELGMKGMNARGWLRGARYIITLGCVYEKLGKKTDAARVFADLKKRYDAVGSLGEVERYRGSFYLMTNEPNIAEPWFRKELAIAVKQGSSIGEMTAMRNIGYCYEEKNKPAAAEMAFRRSLELAKKNLKNDPHHKIADIINEVDRNMRDQKKIKEADRFRIQEGAYLRAKNSYFKSASELYREEMDVLKEVDSISRKK